MAFLQEWKNQGHLTPDSCRTLAAFVRLIHDWNPRVNLTGFKTEAEVEELLVGESLLALPHLSLSERHVLDFGSGAGIPGIAWAIAQPELRLVSVEIRQKKVAFQKEAVRSLGLTNVEVLRGLFPDSVAQRHFDVIVTRAIRFSGRLWEEAAALLRPGGCLVRFGSAGKSREEPGWHSVLLGNRSVLYIKQPS